MDYYKDYLDRLIINEELDSSVLNKLKKITGVSGNVKVVLSKEAEKEINTIKNASMNGASRGLVVAALANDTGSSISSNVRKYGFRIKSDSINEELTDKSLTEKFIIIDYVSSMLNAGLKTEGFIFECLCTNHFEVDGVTATMNDIIKGAKDSISDITLSFGGRTALMQCKWSAAGEENTYTTNFGSPVGKVHLNSMLGSKSFLISGGNNKKCVIMEANNSAITIIETICSKFIEEKSKDKNQGSWFLLRDKSGIVRQTDKNGCIKGISISSGSLNIKANFWNGEHLVTSGGFVQMIADKLQLESSKDGPGKYKFSISNDITKFNTIKEEVFSSYTNKQQTAKRASEHLDTLTKHMDGEEIPDDSSFNRKIKKNSKNLTNKNRIDIKIETINKLIDNNKNKALLTKDKSFKTNEEKQEFQKFFDDNIDALLKDPKLKTNTYYCNGIEKKLKEFEKFYNEVKVSYFKNKKRASIFNY